MQTLSAEDLPAFTRQFRFPGARLRRVTLTQRRGEDPALELLLIVRTATKSLGDVAEKAVLRLRFEGVEEYRFQKRPGTDGGRIPDGRFGTFNGVTYATFDSWSLGPGDVPGVHDFRASDAYVGARRMKWERVK
jgi:hypothetical protein